MVDWLEKIIDDAKWIEVFCIIPTKDIHGKWHWLKYLYARKIWMTENGFHSVPIIQYVTLFDLLRDVPDVE